MRWPKLISLLLLGCGAAVAAPAPTERLKVLKEQLQDTKETQEQLEQKADAVATEIDALSVDMVNLASRIQSDEDTATGLEDQIIGLKVREQALIANLAVRRAQLADSLAALQRLTQRPRELGLVRPEDAQTIVRSAEVLSAVLPALQGKAAALNKALADLQLVRKTLVARQAGLGRTLKDLAARQARMVVLVDERKTAHAAILEQAQAKEKEAKGIVAELGTVERLIARLNEEANRRPRFKPAPPRQKLLAQVPVKEARGSRKGADRQVAIVQPQVRRPAEKEFARVQGSFAQPAAGRVVQLYGQRLDDGGVSKGIRIETRDGAQVVSPQDGQVVYAGPFRDYGQLLIIRHNGGYHTLLAGLGRIDGAVGQSVVAGEPVGAMGGAGGGLPQLYLEVRRNDEPINPVNWLAGKRKKVG